MKVTQDISLSDFDAWSGARPVLDALIENGHVDEAEAEIEDCFPEGIDATALNDWLWFECEDQHPEWFRDEEEDEEEEEEEDA